MNSELEEITEESVKETAREQFLSIRAKHFKFPMKQHRAKGCHCCEALRVIGFLLELEV